MTQLHFVGRHVTAEDLRAMAALDAEKLPYGLQERFIQVQCELAVFKLHDSIRSSRVYHITV